MSNNFEQLAAELFVIAQQSPTDDGFSGTIERIAGWLNEKFGQAEQNLKKADADYWIDSRPRIIDALEKAGLQLMSNADGFWLSHAPQTAQPRQWQAIGEERRMNDVQFAALATLLRMRGPSREAARLVLVDGLTGVAAAAQTGLSAQGVSNAVQRVKAGLELARQAVPSS